MKLERLPLASAERANCVRTWLHENKGRIGLITSIDGKQLITLSLDPKTGTAKCWETPVEGERYHSLTNVIPQCHWFERSVWDLFALYPEGHPRLKHNLLHEPYHPELAPLSKSHSTRQTAEHRSFTPLEVKGEGIYEIPVGPIHAGIIEPGHFRFSCLGEIVLNLEIHLGYVHRGVEKRLTELPWKQTRFLAEAAASDTAAANALAHAIAVESLFEKEVPTRASFLRTLSLEIERVAMHIADVGGIAGDIGFLAISSSLSRLRGNALRLGELLTGTRFQRAFICPGGVVTDPEHNLSKLRQAARQLRKDVAEVVHMLLNNQVAHDRMEDIGRVSPNLANEFGLVGIAARASDVHYDARRHFQHGVYPSRAPAIAVAHNGDIYCRAMVRIAEMENSLALIDDLIDDIPAGDVFIDLGKHLPANATAAAIVEAHRGELIHLIMTDGQNKISRYAIKDPSVNNWTGLAIAIRNNLVADFPLLNKSFSLSYSGHDL